MKSILKSKKICRIIILLILIYTFVSFISQEKKLKNYEQQKQYFSAQIESLKEEQNYLIGEQENIDSPEYIEEQAREKLDMYYPNERVYIAK